MISSLLQRLDNLIQFARGSQIERFFRLPAGKSADFQRHTRWAQMAAHKASFWRGYKSKGEIAKYQKWFDEPEKRARQGNLPFSQKSFNRDRGIILRNISMRDKNFIPSQAPAIPRLKGFLAKLDDLIQFQQSKEEYTKPKHPVAATIGALTLPGYATQAGGAGWLASVSGMSEKAPRAEDRPILARMKQMARKEGYSIQEHENWGQPGLAKTKGFVGPEEKPYIRISKAIRPYAKPGILAHEMGHMQQKWLRNRYRAIPTYLGGQTIPGLSSIYVASTKDPERAKKAAAIGTAGALPMLATEIGASYRGTKILKQAGMKGIRRITPFIGVPTYAAMAAVPGLTYATKKAFGGYKEKKLAALLSDLIEFKLYQPKGSDEPPEQLPQFKPGDVVDYTVQRHAARRAGLHRDVRIGSRLHGLLSWATRGKIPDQGGKVAIHEQPVHPHSYLGWSGNIPSGYGAGDVQTEEQRKALVTKSTPDELHATLSGQKGSHRLAFVRTKSGWLLSKGREPEPPEEAHKPLAKVLRPEKAKGYLKELEPGSSVQPKIDGALVYVTTKGGRPEIFSHRVSKTTGSHPVHTERVFRGRPTYDIPKEHQHTLVAELYGKAKGKAIPPQDLGGLLNAHIHESLRKLKEKGIKLKVMPFDYVDGQGERYAERLAKVKQTLSHLPRKVFHPPEEATTPGAARRLFERIRSGRHPLTKEGVIIHPPEGKMVKVKNVEEANVTIHSTFPGTGKFEGSHGGFYYSDKSGKRLGKVGTGFTDETRRELHKYIGRKARVRYQEKFPSGRLRAPSFIAVDEGK